MTDWITIGAGPTAPDGLRAALGDFPDAQTITCNSGAKLIVPDVYFLSDWRACREWGVVANAYQRLGTRLVTLKRDTSALMDRGVVGFDEFCECPDFVTSGVFTVLWAASRAAKTVALVGHDGYRSRPGKLAVDYFDGREGLEKHAAQTLGVIAPALARIALGFPEIEFVRYGKPTFRIQANNWTERQ